MLKNVRQTLTMAAITGVLAAAPLTLSNATAFAADDMRWDPNTVGAPFEAAGFVPAPPAPETLRLLRTHLLRPMLRLLRTRRLPMRHRRRPTFRPAPDAPPPPAPDAPAPPAPEAPRRRTGCACASGPACR